MNYLADFLIKLSGAKMNNDLLISSISIVFFSFPFLLEADLAAKLFYG